jgi:carbon storage regulator
MHIVNCRKHESIVIDGEITITVIEIRDDVVRLGITCPPGVSVRRGELHDAFYARSAADPDDRGMCFVDLPASRLRKWDKT